LFFRAEWISEMQVRRGRIIPFTLSLVPGAGASMKFNFFLAKAGAILGATEHGGVAFATAIGIIVSAKYGARAFDYIGGKVSRAFAALGAPRNDTAFNESGP
jgi:hypothetical protein